MITIHFTCYTYIIALLQSPLKVDETAIPFHLLLSGLTGAIGILLAGTLSLRPSAMTALAGTGVAVSLFLMLTAPPLTGYTWFVMAVLGSVIALLIIDLQSWVIALAPDNAEFASALYVIAFNIGIGGWAMAGELMLERLGSASLLYASIGIALAGLMVWAWTACARRTPSTPAANVVQWICSEEK